MVAEMKIRIFFIDLVKLVCEGLQKFCRPFIHFLLIKFGNLK